MWTLEDLRDPEPVMACINGKWVPARPLNYQKGYMAISKRVRAAWEVFNCRAEAFKWPEGQ